MTHAHKIDKAQLDLIQYALKANVDAKLFYYTHSMHSHSNLQNNSVHTIIDIWSSVILCDMCCDKI